MSEGTAGRRSWLGATVAMALTAVAAGILVWGVLPGGPAGGLEVRARFPDVTGLPRDAQVQVGGVPVGRVTGLAWRDGAAEVTMRIDPRARLPRETEAILRSRSLLGERFIDLRPAGRADVPLRQGDVLTRTRRSMDPDRLLDMLGPSLEALPPERLARLVENLDLVLVKAAAAVDHADATLGRIDRGLAHVETLGDAAARDVRAVGDLARDIRPMAAPLLKDASRTVRTLDGVLTRDLGPLLVSGGRLADRLPGMADRLDHLALRLEHTLDRADPMVERVHGFLEPENVHRILREDGIRVHVAPFR